MKKVFMFLFAVMFSVGIWAQNAYQDLLAKYGGISMEHESVYCMGAPMDYEMTFDEVREELKAGGKISTDPLDNNIRCKEFVLFYKLSDYALSYNTATKRFTFYIGVNDYNTTLDMRYIGVGKEICLTFPTSHVKRSKIKTAYGDYFIQQFLSVTMPQDVAKTVLSRVNSSNHDVNIAFIVKPIKVLSEKRIMNYGGYVGTQAQIDDFLINKTIGMYVVDARQRKFFATCRRI